MRSGAPRPRDDGTHLPVRSHECDYLIEARLITVGRRYPQRRYREGERLESIRCGHGTSVGSSSLGRSARPGRIWPYETSIENTLPCQLRIDSAVNDLHGGLGLYVFKAEPPSVILEGGLRHKGYAGRQQQLNRAEEHVEGQLRDTVLAGDGEVMVEGVEDPFIDLISR